MEVQKDAPILLALVVEDLGAVDRRLGDAGVEFSSEILPPEPEPDVGRLLFFQDPDGNLL